MGRRRITRLRVLLLGVLPEWRGRGIDALLYRRIWENGRARGFPWAEAGWMLEDNHAMRNALPAWASGRTRPTASTTGRSEVAVTGATGFIGPPPRRRSLERAARSLPRPPAAKPERSRWQAAGS